VESPTAHRETHSDAGPQFLTLETNAAAEFLGEPKNLKLIDPFLQSELSVKEFADRCDLTANAAFKIVRKLETLGMITCSQEIVRRGKPIKMYKATAPAFFVPFTHIPAEHFIGQITKSNWETMLAAMHKLFSEGHLIEGGYGAITSRTPNGRIMLTPAKSNGQVWDANAADFPAFVAAWLRLKLSFADAKALQKDLVKLYSSYLQRDGSGDYLMGLFLIESPRE
jgi:hypothetical protein